MSWVALDRSLRLADKHSFPADRARRLQVRDPGYKAVIERVFVIRVEAFAWNCPQHITPRFTEDQIQEALAPIERRMQELEQDNERLREELTRLGARAKTAEHST